MAARFALRSVSRRFSSSGKIFSEEEKAAENIYIKKTEQEKLEKLARKGPNPAAEPAASATETIANAKPSSTSSSTEGVSTDKYRNYAVVTGVVTALGALGWYLKSKGKKTEEIHD